jgi:hypothetical protein
MNDKLIEQPSSQKDPSQNQRKGIIIASLCSFFVLYGGKIYDHSLRACLLFTIIVALTIYLTYIWPDCWLLNRRRNLLYFIYYILSIFFIFTLIPVSLNDFKPDKPSPSDVGDLITWKAEIKNFDIFDSHHFLYRFKLFDGWIRNQNYEEASEEATWTWNTSGLPAGNYQIMARVRENRPVTNDEFDDEIKVVEPYELKSRDMPFDQEPNSPPSIIRVICEPDSPQAIGTDISIAVIAEDQDNDQILYKMVRRPPGWISSDVNSWMALDVSRKDWTFNNVCIWKSSEVGPNLITILVRDGKHQPSNSWDDAYDLIFTVTEDMEYESIEETTNFSPDILSDFQNQNALSVYQTNIHQGYSVEAEPINNSIEIVEDNYSQEASEKNQSSSQLNSGTISFDLVDQSNALPRIHNLNSDKISPQIYGSPIRWTVSASDPEGDQVYYKFLLRGPVTGNAWTIQRDWGISNSWTWSNDINDIGENSIKVQIIDGNHADVTSYDASYSTSFEITPPNYITDSEFKNQIKDNRIDYNSISLIEPGENWYTDLSDNRTIRFSKMGYEVRFHEYYDKSDYEIVIKINDQGNPQDLEFKKDSDNVQAIPNSLAESAKEKLLNYCI